MAAEQLKRFPALKTHIPRLKGTVWRPANGWIQIHLKTGHCQISECGVKERILQISGGKGQAHLKDQKPEWLQTSEEAS